MLRHGTAAEPPGTAERRAQTHCKRGHKFTERNTRISGGRRYCRACARARSRACYARSAR
jgi:hypothetical protein